MKRRIATLLGTTAAMLILGAGEASAHPLGNFTVNHYDGITITPDTIFDHAVVDTAEIPTVQARPGLDLDHDGTVDATERAAHARDACATLTQSIHVTIDGADRPLSVRSASFDYRPGAAGLSTSRLSCLLRAPVQIESSTTLQFSDTYQDDRIGWREITARGDRTHLVDSPVPADSISDELLRYPNDLLSSPLNVRTATLDIRPGAGVSTVADGLAKVPGAGPLTRSLAAVNGFFTGLVGARHLTVGVGLLAVAVSLLLGACHAALPGHGKTVMAAYLAGKSGSTRDAVLVGATVTATHTAGVILLGIALTMSASIAGDSVLRDLGVVSGVIIAVVGLGLLRTAIRRHRDHHPAHTHDDGHAHGHHHHRHDPHGSARTRHSRAGLLGMGIAGGLVPSPSALVVLLGAIALGRTAFGVVLVLAYGVGMAATLTAAGLLLVRLGHRYGARLAKVAPAGKRLAAATPTVTASLVVLVGLGLTVRSLAVI